MRLQSSPRLVSKRGHQGTGIIKSRAISVTVIRASGSLSMANSQMRAGPLLPCLRAVNTMLQPRLSKTRTTCPRTLRCSKEMVGFFELRRNRWASYPSIYYLKETILLSFIATRRTESRFTVKIRDIKMIDNRSKSKEKTTLRAQNCWQSSSLPSSLIVAV